MKPTKNQLKKRAEQKITLELTMEELSTIYDLFCFIDLEDIKLNFDVKKFSKLHEKIERIVVPELYEKSKE